MKKSKAWSETDKRNLTILLPTLQTEINKMKKTYKDREN